MGSQGKVDELKIRLAERDRRQATNSAIRLKNQPLFDRAATLLNRGFFLPPYALTTVWRFLAFRTLRQTFSYRNLSAQEMFNGHSVVIISSPRDQLPGQLRVLGPRGTYFHLPQVHRSSFGASAGAQRNYRTNRAAWAQLR